MDYLGYQYWSDPFTLSAGESTVRAEARGYLFSATGAYLSRSEVTDEYGTVRFTVPEGSYTLRIDSNGQQYWTEVVNIIGYQATPLEVELSELVATSNPRPIRVDGEPPLYAPQLAVTGELDPLFSLPVVAEPRTFYFISDHLGTGQLLVDQEQQVVWQANYQPFGQLDVVVDRVGNSFRFPGQYFDGETGLYYNWHRFYDPETGRYITGDPIGLQGGINLYRYAKADPVNWFDPNGKEPTTILAIVIGAWAIAYVAEVGDLISDQNGNVWGEAQDQDNVCSLPWPIGPIANQCVLDRCQRHDICYDENGCTASSWAANALGGTKACNQCNSGFFE